MNDLFVIFWGVLIAASIFWYGFLVFYVGSKAGREILDLARTLGGQRPGPREPAGHNPGMPPKP
ncbi:MAG: hypothetical protein ACREIA_14160 [Opitutaceae bacterium]